MERLSNGLRRALSLVFALALLASAFPKISHAESFFAVVTSDTMRVYRNANLVSLWGILKKLDVVEVLDYNGSTARVKKGKNIGYARISDMQRADAIAEDAYINTDCSVYLTPDENDEPIRVSKNLAVRYLGCDQKWALLERNGMIAYCPKACITLADAKDEKEESSVVYDRFEAYVTAASARVYAGASEASAFLGCICQNTVVTVKAYNDTWAQISLNGRTGYCLRSQLARSSAPAPSETPEPESGSGADEIIFETFNATVTGEKARVFNAPSESGRYLGNASASVTVRVFAYNSRWAYIGLNGRYGYTERSNLSRVSENSPSPTAKPTPTPTPKPTPTPSPTPRPVKKTESEIFNGPYTNEQKIYYFLTDIAGYNTAVACGIMANIRKESTFNPAAVSSSGNYHGLCQWSNGRFDTISDYCQTHGYEPYSLEGQLHFLMYDLSTLQAKYGRELSKMENSAQGAYDAGYYFCYYYERPSNKAVKSDERGTLARETYWEKYGY